MSELYQAPKSPAQSERIPIRTAFDDPAAELLDDDATAELVLLVVFFLLLPQAATHSPHSAHSATTARVRGKRCLIPNLVTS
jgi:hypothetical protein